MFPSVSLVNSLTNFGLPDLTFSDDIFEISTKKRANTKKPSKGLME